MATPTIVATVGGATSNSFGTLAEANTYHDSVYHPDAIWSDLGDDVKTPCLIMAQQQMTSLICWTGFLTNITQKLPWPRNSMWDRSGFVAILSTVIPDEVKACQFELARLLGYTDRTVEYEVGANGIVRVKAGSVAVTFKDRRNPGPAVIPSVAYSLLVPSWYESIDGIERTNMDLERA